jgi:hypothetical protein
MSGMPDYADSPKLAYWTLVCLVTLYCLYAVWAGFGVISVTPQWFLLLPVVLAALGAWKARPPGRAWVVAFGFAFVPFLVGLARFFV